jgi:hypothetical protein
MFVYIKKHLLGLCFIVFLLVTMWPLNSFAGEPITVFFNNVQIELDIPPVLDHSRVLIPLKVVSGTLGAQMNWDPETKTITALTRTKFLRLSLDEKKAFVNGNKLDWDAPVKIIKGRTMVPIRFVAENLGLWVEWQAEFKRVVIKDKQSNLGQNLSQREEFLPGEWPISYKRIQNENSPQGFHQDLYRTTLFGNENRLVVEDIPRDYSWSPSGTRVAMDADGIPLHYELFPGNKLDKETFRSVIGEVRRNYDTGRIVVVADMGIITGDNIYYLTGGKNLNGYVFSFSVRVLG